MANHNFHIQTSHVLDVYPTHLVSAILAQRLPNTCGDYLFVHFLAYLVVVGRVIDDHYVVSGDVDGVMATLLQ